MTSEPGRRERGARKIGEHQPVAEVLEQCPLTVLFLDADAPHDHETGIDLVTVSDLRRLYEARLAKNEPLPISVSIGVHQPMNWTTRYAIRSRAARSGSQER